MEMWLALLVFGAIVGSFLNVVIYRYNTGRSVVKGRSVCLVCGRTLHWFELLPVVSFLIQLGRCRQCGTKISWQYPLVELATAVLFLAVWVLAFPPLSTVLLWAIFSVLVVITVYDLRHKIIPDGLVVLFIFLSLVVSRFDFTAILSGLGLAAFFALLWLISRGRWMGLGDAKLALGVGLLLGPRAGISAIVLSFWLGAIVGVALILWTRLFHHRESFTIKSEIPFAPFIIAGLVASFFLNFDVFFFFL